MDRWMDSKNVLCLLYILHSTIWIWRTGHWNGREVDKFTISLEVLVTTAFQLQEAVAPDILYSVRGSEGKGRF